MPLRFATRLMSKNSRSRRTRPQTETVFEVLVWLRRAILGLTESRVHPGLVDDRR